MAAVLAAGPGAAASHLTAGALSRFDGILPPLLPEVLVAFGRHPTGVPGASTEPDLGPADLDRAT